MSMRKLTLSDAYDMGRNLPWVYVRSWSTVVLGSTSPQINSEEILEVRFFSSNMEIRIFRREKELEAVMLDDRDEIYVDRVFLLANPAFGKEIVVRQYMDFDDDGQAYWKDCRLSGWKEMKK